MSSTRTVFISGVSRGLGRAMALEFAKSDWTVLGCGRSEEPIASLRKSLGAPHVCEVVDVRDAKQVDAFAETLSRQSPVPDLILNNAGVINPNAPLWEVSPEEFDRVIDTNIKGAFYVIRALLPPMIQRGTGVIVNFSSGWGRSTSPEVAPYCATKWAIEGLSEALAQELPDGLAAAAMNPGVINTSMLHSCFGTAASAYPTAEEWAQTAVPFLAGLDASCNGKALTAP